MSANLPSHLVSTIFKKLETLACPFIEEDSEQWLAKLLLHPSETRLKFLTWCVCTFDSEFEELIDSHVPLISNQVDSRHQKLLSALNAMNVCKIDDIEIIRGTCSPKKQMTFWDDLIDMLYTFQQGQSYIHASALSLQNENYYLKPMPDPTVDKNFKSCCKFIDTLTRKYTSVEIFSEQLHMFSPDIESLIEENHHQTVPTFDMLIQTLEKMKNEIDVHSDALDSLVNSYVAPEQSCVENYCRKIDLSLKTLLQVIDSFVHCYEEEFETWTNKSSARLSGVGPRIKCLGDIAHSYYSMCHSLKMLKSAASFLQNDLNMRAKWNCENLVTLSEIDRIRDMVQTLQLSIQRKSKT